MSEYWQRDRWLQLGLVFIAMMAISSAQYLWTLFVGPIGKALGGSLPALQVTFLLLIVLQTFLLAVPGLLDRALRHADADFDRRRAGRFELDPRRARIPLVDASLPFGAAMPG